MKNASGRIILLDQLTCLWTCFVKEQLANVPEQWTTWFLPLTISALFMHFKKHFNFFFILIPGSPFSFLSCKRLKMFIFSQFQDVQIQIYTFICTWKHASKYPGSPVDTYQVSLEQLVNVTNKSSCVYLPITRSMRKVK